MKSEEVGKDALDAVSHPALRDPMTHENIESSVLERDPIKRIEADWRQSK
jgi:hypothetical protein